MPTKPSSHGAGQLERRRRGMRATAPCILIALLAVAAPSVHALTYRCEVSSGQAGKPPEVRYQSQACDGGRALHNADHRTDAQRADTSKATQANAKLGKRLERERRRQEKQGANRPPLAMDQAKPPARPASTSTEGQTLKRTHPFTARTPKTPAGSKSKSD